MRVFIADDLTNFLEDGKSKTTRDGYVVGSANVARVGIQKYKGFELGRPDLGDVNVLRPEAEVFKTDAMRSIAYKPITLLHPSESVTPDNWNKYSKGQVGGEVVRDGDHIRVPMILMDAGLIKAHREGGVSELSLGYSTDLKWTPGVLADGSRYDAVQTDIFCNHLAFVPVARGGSKLRFGDAAITNCPKCGTRVDAQKQVCDCGYAMLDGAPPKTCIVCDTKMHHYAINCPSCQAAQMTDGSTRGKRTMSTIIQVDGAPVTVADDTHGALITGALRRANDAAACAKADKEKADKEKGEMADALTKANAAIVAKDAQIAVLTKEIETSKVSDSQLDLRVIERSGLLADARKFLGDAFVIEGKSNVDIKRAAVAVKLGDAAKTMSEDGINAAFATIVALAADGSSPGSGVRTMADALGASVRAGAAVGGRSNAAEVAARDAAFEDKIKRKSEAWKGAVN